MLRLPKLQMRPVLKTRSLQLNATRLLTTARKFGPTATCITLNKTNYFSSKFWRTTGLVAATGLAYSLANSKVLALETSDRKSYS